jgi:ABC-type transporter Mla subunit MlaD
VQRTVELDEIFRSLDDQTRRDFQVWMQSTAAGLRGRGQDFNDALGNLAPFAENTTDLLEILDRQRPAVQGLIKNTAVVFDALAGRNGELRDLISNSNTVFSTVAARNDSLQAFFKALPTFEREGKLTVERFDQFARETDPLLLQLQPVARELSPTLQSLSRLAPSFRNFFVDLGPLITASYRGLPAFQKFLDDLRPALGQLDPFTRTLNPVLRYIRDFLPEIDAFFGNFSVATNAFSIGGGQYLRATAPITPESLATYPQRLAYNRGNPYRAPGTAAELLRGLASFETRQCAGNFRPTPNLPPNLARILGGISQDAVGLLQLVAYRATADPPGSSNLTSGSYTNVPASACRLQGRFPGFAGDYPHVVADPPTRP